jgi:uncharacterized protein (TIGR00251 family)
LEFLEVTGKGVLLRIKVQPGAQRNEFAGNESGELKIRIAAPPREGEANRECMRFVAKAFGIAKSDVEIVRGAKSRHKVLLLRGVAKSVEHDLRSAIKDLSMKHDLRSDKLKSAS